MKSSRTGCDRSIMPGILLVLLSLCGLLTACAQAHSVGIKPSGPLTEVGEGAKGPTQSAPVGNRESLKEFLKDFQLKILTENHGICPGPDGKDMIFLGRGARLQLILRFSQTPSVDVKAGDLIARIAGLNLPFVRRTSEKTYMTDIIDLSALKHGLNTGPSGVSIFYKDRDKEILLGTKGMLAIDTIPPPKPVNFYVTDTGPDYFFLTWENGKGESKEYSVQIWDSGKWVTISSGFNSPPVRLNSKPEGRVRVMAIDCALNRAFSQDVVLGRDDKLSITRTGCGRSKYLAYRAAQILIDEGFVREYVSPWLKSNATLTNGEVNTLITERHEGWVPPGIKFTPQNKAEYHKEDGKWCAEVTGALNRTPFKTWAGNKAKAFKTQKKHGIMVDANGPGSDILAGYFKKQASSRGLTIYEQKGAPAIAPAYGLKINVDLGRPQRLNVYGVYCWYVKATMKLSEKSTGKNIVLHLSDIPDVDIRIYGKSLDQAIRGPGPNSFSEKIADPFIKGFMLDLNRFLTLQ
ncbi:MAG: fibronectin type III domain-containing protein [Desulfobacterales bacterium]|nr:fibronectin type III domain-containing protein [Desulfobacterales bacterium]MBL7171203.1 fibronectin type III domain-containing protein [Desulfobacteraceae bacterium]